MASIRHVINDQTTRFFVTTSDTAGGAVAPSSAFENADFVIYKDGSATQKTTQNGITMTSPFDSVVGLHLLEIDTSNDTGDSGFWAIGSIYDVVAQPDETVDSQTVVSIIGTFRLVSGEEYYPDGVIHVDSGAANTSTTVGKDGTVGNPVSTLAAAKTIADTLGMQKIYIHNGSSLTAAGSLANYTIDGQSYTLALGGQSFDGAKIKNAAAVSGTFTGTPEFENCALGAITGPSAIATRCGLTGTVTANGAGDWYFHNCFSQGTTVIDLGAAVANTNLRVLGYNGSLELQNVGQAGTDAVTINGIGDLTVNANCVGGAIDVQGIWGVTDNGAATIDYTVNLSLADTFGGTSAEPTTPPVLGTASLKAALEWVAHMHINEINQTESQVAVRNAADSANIGEATYSNDGTTVVRGKFSAP